MQINQMQVSRVTLRNLSEVEMLSNQNYNALKAYTHSLIL